MIGSEKKLVARVFESPNRLLLIPIIKGISKSLRLLNFKFIIMPEFRKKFEPILMDLFLRHADEFEIAKRTIDPFDKNQKPKYVLRVTSNPECFPEIWHELNEKYHRITYILALMDIAGPWLTFIDQEIKSNEVSNWSDEKTEKISSVLFELHMFTDTPRLRRQIWQLRTSSIINT